MRYQGKKALILGLGKSGRAVCEFLKENGAETGVYDDVCASDPEVLCDRYDFAVISPGVSPKHPIVRGLAENGVPILSEIDLAYLNCLSDRIFAVSINSYECGVFISLIEDHSAVNVERIYPLVGYLGKRSL